MQDITDTAFGKVLVFVLDVIGQDLRYALRGLRNNKGLTFAIVVTLTLSLGVNAAVPQRSDQNSVL